MSLAELRAWCEEHGARTHGIDAAAVQHGRGVVAQRDLERGELILSVPGELLLSGRSARADPGLSAALASCSGITAIEVQLCQRARCRS